MSGQHTLGPWTCDLNGDGIGPVIWAGETRIAHTCWWPKDKAQEQANARLIAAAPEMLEALRITRGNVASLGPSGALEPYAPYREWLAMIDAAIAKVTGETT